MEQLIAYKVMIECVKYELVSLLPGTGTGQQCLLPSGALYLSERLHSPQPLLLFLSSLDGGDAVARRSAAGPHLDLQSAMQAGRAEEGGERHALLLALRAL